MDMRCAHRFRASVRSERYPDPSALASATTPMPPFPASLTRRRGKEIFHAAERIDRKGVEEAQDLISRLADAMFGHAWNEDRASRAPRAFTVIEGHDPSAGEHVIDFGRRVPMQPKPVARP